MSRESSNVQKNNAKQMCYKKGCFSLERNLRGEGNKEDRTPTWIREKGTKGHRELGLDDSKH